ncbi:ArsR/SmtB family transcription factor [Ferrovibrio sp.]|uniref:ArsR/SmtB family transcription factor n=1 Tax=Ferrovibrio sp. TaxID=1917215 RepID=UPI003D294375
MASRAATKKTKPAADCCPPDASPAELVEVARPEDDELAELAKALGHPVRILIVRNLLRIGTCYFGKLADLLPVAASTASQHLTILKDAGLVKGDISESRPCYCVDVKKLRRLQHLIGDL